MPTALPLTNKISDKSSKKREFREFSTQFGDGYAQVAPAGLNAGYDVWDITWVALEAGEVTSIESVLDTNGSWGILTWTPCHEATQKKFRMTKDGYSRSNIGNSGKFTISCTLKQVFDIT